MERNYSDDVQNPKEREKAEILHRVIMERIKNGENPYKGSVVKSGNYVYQKQNQEKQAEEKDKTLSREEKINEVLENLEKCSPQLQDKVNSLIEAQKQLKEKEEALKEKEEAVKKQLLEEVLKINAPQTRVDKDKAKGEER